MTSIIYNQSVSIVDIYEYLWDHTLAGHHE